MKDDAPIDQREAGFLTRWSRRKRQPDADAVVEGAPAVVEAAATEPEPEPLLTDDDMPPVESLNEGSDYSGFLSPGVSEELRQLALRKLFRAASFNIPDGLDDYDEDFTSFAKLGDIVTREMRVRNAIDAAREKAKELLAAMETAPTPEQAAVAGAPGENISSVEKAPIVDDQPGDAVVAEASEERPTVMLDQHNDTLQASLQEIPNEQQSQPA